MYLSGYLGREAMLFEKARTAFYDKEAKEKADMRYVLNSYYYVDMD